MKTLAVLLGASLTLPAMTLHAAAVDPGVLMPKIWSGSVCYSNGTSAGYSGSSKPACDDALALAISNPPYGTYVTGTQGCRLGPGMTPCLPGFPLTIEAGPDGDVQPILNTLRRIESLRQNYRIDAYERELLDLYQGAAAPSGR